MADARQEKVQTTICEIVSKTTKNHLQNVSRWCKSLKIFQKQKGDQTRTHGDQRIFLYLFFKNQIF